MVEYMPTDMQYKDELRKDKFFNDLVIEALENGDKEKALEYLRKDNERIEKALEEQTGNEREDYRYLMQRQMILSCSYQ